MNFLGDFDKESKSEKKIGVVGGRGCGRGGGLVYISEQMFQMALLFFKENTCAKLF